MITHPSHTSWYSFLVHEFMPSPWMWAGILDVLLTTYDKSDRYNFQAWVIKRQWLPSWVFLDHSFSEKSTAMSWGNPEESPIWVSLETYETSHGSELWSRFPWLKTEMIAPLADFLLQPCERPSQNHPDKLLKDPEKLESNDVNHFLCYVNYYYVIINSQSINFLIWI